MDLAILIDAPFSALRAFVTLHRGDGDLIAAINACQDEIQRAVVQRPGHMAAETDYIDIVFDGPPGPQSGWFVEVENAQRASVAVGRWIQRDDGFWALRLPVQAQGIDLPAARSGAEIDRLMRIAYVPGPDGR